MEQDINTLMAIVSEIKLSYIPEVKASLRPIVKKPEEAYQLFLQTWDTTKLDYVEQFKVMLINRANRVLGICTLASGSNRGTIADPQQVFAVALKANATSLIVAHNHPSGNTTPSKNDVEITQRMKKAGEVLDINVLDHLIVTSEGYYSFADDGTL